MSVVLKKDTQSGYVYSVINSEGKILGKVNRIGGLSSNDYRFNGLTFSELKDIVQAIQDKIQPFGPSPVYFACGCIEPRETAGQKCKTYNKARLVY